MRKLAIAFAACATLQYRVPAFAAVIDFETQGAGAPASFNGRPNSPLVIGIATFSGGELLRSVSGAADTTAVYGTTNLVAGAYSDPLTITFSQPVSAFSLLLTNELPDTYTVFANTAAMESLFLNANTSQTFSLAGAGITSVSVANSQTFQWDFAVDNVSFTTAIPEPATFWTASLFLLAAGLGLLLQTRGMRKGQTHGSLRSYSAPT